MTVKTAIALNRFGLGARPDEAPPPDAGRWLKAQFDRFEVTPQGFAALPAAARIAADYTQGLQQVRAADAEAKRAARQMLGGEGRDHYRAAVNARAASALTTPAPFVERLVHFWSNHFAVSANGLVKSAFVPVFERDAIRPHVLGRFEDMLLAVERHPAMLIFLDQARSVGPASTVAERVAMRNPARKRGLNENLAREAMELHTLGARSGYTQADVTEFARALTGWGVGGFGAGGRQGEPGQFLFRPAVHEPGARNVLGKSYDQPGEAQGKAILSDIAAMPATATHLATKLARHFVADDPPPALVARLAGVFTKTRGDLPSLYAALADAPEAWTPTQAKFKTPWEWTISSLRGIGRTSLEGVQVAQMLQQLGQPVWRPGSPAGWEDTAASWAAPDALVRRVELAQRFANQSGDRVDPRALAAKLLPGTLTAATTAAIARAESVQTGLALLLVSPEFQRR